MNQDAYYSEGLKLPLVLTLFMKRTQRRCDEKGLDSPRRRGFRRARNPRKSLLRSRNLIGGDDVGVIGFREHVFTFQHSVVGRYMALAEHSFGTIVQRFLYRPHHIRMHYGHPDVANALLLRKTGGLSRGSQRVNVNEDIFLGVWGPRGFRGMVGSSRSHGQCCVHR